MSQLSGRRGGSTWLGQNPKFFQKFDLKASLINIAKDYLTDLFVKLCHFFRGSLKYGILEANSKMLIHTRNLRYSIISKIWNRWLGKRRSCVWMDPTGSSTGDDDNLDGQGCSTKRKFGENFQVETLHPLSSFSLFYFFSVSIGLYYRGNK